MNPAALAYCWCQAYLVRDGSDLGATGWARAWIGGPLWHAHIVSGGGKLRKCAVPTRESRTAHEGSGPH